MNQITVSVKKAHWLLQTGNYSLHGSAVIGVSRYMT